jgi:hypothetical protein
MQIYEAVAYAMRYWFVLVILAILFCVIVISIVEYRDRKKVMANAESFVGYVDVLNTSANNLEEGDRFALAKSNIIGSSASCNIIINEKGIMKKHMRIDLKDEGVFLEVYAPNNTQLNGRPVKNATRVASGDMLLIGSTSLMVHLKEDEE